MTEQEAINTLKYQKESAFLAARFIDAMDIAVKALEEIQRYRAIGTVEECREARERQRGKKPIKNEYNHHCCPDCGWIVCQDEYGGRYLPHCENCGQAIDWGDIECQNRN